MKIQRIAFGFDMTLKDLYLGMVVCIKGQTTRNFTVTSYSSLVANLITIDNHGVPHVLKDFPVDCLVCPPQPVSHLDRPLY